MNMSLILSVVFTVIGFFILMYLSTNLLGLFVRGLFSDPALDKLEREGNDLLKHEIKKDRRADMWVNLVALILIAAYLCLLLYFLNVFAVVAALMIMVARLPDLLWEIGHGKRINIETTPKDWVFWVTSLLSWGALPMLWYALSLTI